MTFVQKIDIFFRKSLVPLNKLRMTENPNEVVLVDELRERVKKVSMPRKADTVNDQWLGNIVKLKKLILTQDPKNFLQWDIIRKSMFIGNALFTVREFLFLLQNNWDKWHKAVRENNFIPTEPYLLNPKSSGNLIHQAYHLARFEQETGKKIQNFDFILEFGGGYGGMCQLVHNLGFKKDYVIFDLPILSALQTFFLEMNGLKTSFDGSDKKANISCLYSINKLKKIVPKKGKKLLIATWSLSESPLEIRKKLYTIIKKFDGYIVSYQKDFANIDNHKYFEGYKKNLDKILWWNEEIVQLRNNYYLFGSQ